METRSPGQKEYEDAVSLFLKPKLTEKDIVESVELFKKAFDLKYTQAVRIVARIIAKNHEFPISLFPDDSLGNQFYKKLVANPKAYNLISGHKFNAEMQTYIAMQLPSGNSVYTPLIEIMLCIAAKRPDPCFYACYAYPTMFPNAFSDDEKLQLIQSAALAGLPIAQLLYAMMLITGNVQGANIFVRYLVTLGLSGVMHAKKIQDAFKEFTPAALFSIVRAKKKEKFDFDDALEILTNPPPDLAPLADSLKKIWVDEVEGDNSSIQLVKCILLMEKDPIANAERVFIMLRRMAYIGDPQALYMFSFLILRAAISFSQENPIIVRNIDKKLETTLLQETTRRDKIVLKLLENEKVRTILKADHSDVRNLKTAFEFLDNVTKPIEILKKELEKSKLGLNSQLSIKLDGLKTSPLMLRSGSFSKMIGVFLALSQANQSTMETMFTNDLVNKLVLETGSLTAYVTMTALVEGDNVPVNLLKAYEIVKTFAKADHEPARYVCALLCYKAFGIKMPDSLSKFNADAKYQIEREVVNKILSDAAVKEQIKLQGWKKEKSSLVEQDGEKEFLKAIELMESGISLKSKQHNRRSHLIVDYLEKAAAKNYVRAYPQLALQLLCGDKKDEVRAFKLITSAAAAGDEISKLILNRMLNFKERKEALVPVGEGIAEQYASRFIANQSVMKLFAEYLQEESRKKEAEALKSVSLPAQKSSLAEEKKSVAKVKEETRPIPKFKSSFFGTLSSNKHVDLQKILPQDPLFLIKVVHGLVYKKLDVSGVALIDLKERALSLALCERDAEFWRLLGDGLMYGKGRDFIHKLREMGFAEYLFGGDCTAQDLDYIEFRANEFDLTLKANKRPLFFDGKHVNPDFLYALVIEKELAKSEPITVAAVKAVVEKFKIPAVEVNEKFLVLIKEERTKKEEFVASKLESIKQSLS